MPNPHPSLPESATRAFTHLLMEAARSVALAHQGQEGTIHLVSLVDPTTSEQFSLIIHLTRDPAGRTLKVHKLAVIPPDSLLARLRGPDGNPFPDSIPIPDDVPMDPTPPTSVSRSAGTTTPRIILPGDPGFPLP